VELDSKLLRDIEKETKEVADQQRMGKIFGNVVAAVTGRLSRLKALETELMARVQTITTLMMKDVWKVLPTFISYPITIYAVIFVCVGGEWNG
jgi:hypothetical protein